MSAIWMTWLAACIPLPVDRPAPAEVETFVTEWSDPGPPPRATCDEARLDLDPPDIEAGTSWELAVGRAELYDLGSGDYAADWDSDECLILAPAGLRIDLTETLCPYDQLTVRIVDDCRTGCTTLQTFSAGALTRRITTTGAGSHTFVVADCQAIDELTIESQSATVCPLKLAPSTR